MSCAPLRNTSVIVVVFLLIASASGQVATGTPPFSSSGGGPFDVIDLANLNVHVEIPVVNKAGRGLPFSYNLKYDSSVWYPTGTSGNQTWAHVLNFGWPAQTEIATGSVTIGRIFTTPCYDPDFGTITITHTIFNAFTDASGLRHPFNLGVVDDSYCGGRYYREPSLDRRIRLHALRGWDSANGLRHFPYGLECLSPAGRATASLQTLTATLSA